jgi:cobalt transporter subunit CbtA
MFKGIVSAGALAGVLSGLLLTVIQQIEIVPLIRKAEVREEAAATASKSSHTHATINRAREAWAPSTARERLLATGVSNVVVATGFALLLSATISLRGATGWRMGLAYGAAGYIVFFVAPSLGLPPELPGAVSAPLRERELWWIATVIASAAGLGLIAFCRKPPLRILGLALLVAPHAIGAPQPPVHAGIHSAESAKEFIRATYLANAAFWMALGGLLGFFVRIRQ